MAGAAGCRSEEAGVAGTNPVAVQQPGAESRLGAGWPEVESVAVAGVEAVSVAGAVVRLLRDRWVRRDRSWIRS